MIDQLLIINSIFKEIIYTVIIRQIGHFLKLGGKTLNLLLINLTNFSLYFLEKWIGCIG